MMIHAVYESDDCKRRAEVSKIAARRWDVACFRRERCAAARGGYAWSRVASHSSEVKSLTSAQGKARSWVSGAQA